MGVTQISELTFDVITPWKDFFEVSFLKLDFAGMFAVKDGNVGQTILTVVMLVISFSLVNMFDSIGTLLGAAKQAGLIDKEGNAIRMREALMADAISTAGTCESSSFFVFTPQRPTFSMPRRCSSTEGIQNT